MFDFLCPRFFLLKGSVQQVHPQQKQISRDIRFDSIAIEQICDKIGTDDSTNATCHHNLQKQFLINIGKTDMRKSRYTSRKNLRRMHTSRSKFGRNTKREQ